MVSDAAWFPSISQLELRVDGVLVVSRHLYTIFMIMRASTRRVNEQRQFRDSFARRHARRHLDLGVLLPARVYDGERPELRAAEADTGRYRAVWSCAAQGGAV